MLFRSNHRTYPHLIRLFAELGVDTAPSDMSFSVQSHADGLEWSGSNLNTVFAQRRNLVRPAFLAMLRDILRFNREAPALLDGPEPGLGGHRFQPGDGGRCRGEWVYY